MLGVDPLTVIAGDLDDKPQLPILLALTDEAAERVGEDVLRRWLRATGPGGRPLDHLLASDYGAFEDDLATLAERGLVLRGSRASGGRVTPPRVRRIAPDEGETLRAVRLRALADAPLAFGSTHAREAAYPPERWRDWAEASSAGGGQAFFFAVDEHLGRAGRPRVGRDLGGGHRDGAPLRDVGRARGAGQRSRRGRSSKRSSRGRPSTAPLRVRTEVTVGNDGAARLYERAGFRDTGRARAARPLGRPDRAARAAAPRLTSAARTRRAARPCGGGRAPRTHHTRDRRRSRRPRDPTGATAPPRPPGSSPAASRPARPR